MVCIQSFKGNNKLANGKKGKECQRHFVIILSALVKALAWKKGDELEFKLEGGKVVLRRKEI